MTAFRRLAAWRRSHALAVHVHDITGRSAFADQPALALELRRAAIEIPGHVAEGSGYAGGSGFAQSLELALCVARRLHSHAVLARDLRTLTTSEFARLDARVDEVCRILVGLRRTVLAQPPRSSAFGTRGKPAVSNSDSQRKPRVRQRPRSIG
ncbi:MAG TPA: four helix bundle protein [Gemmatimonadaceae bacterium]